jgi:CBS domain containing-hemolysin-like protein
MTTILILLLGFGGLALSAFFSGTEIGFYRTSRIRLVLDAKGGDRVARLLVALGNRPVFFVATILVGNNIANYFVSLSLVIGAEVFLGTVHPWIEVFIPLVFAPFLFVYGELIPKQIFLQAPRRLLRRSGPVMLGFVVLFLPVSVFLWGLNWILARLLGESPQRMQLRLARRELHGVLEEGREIGIVHPSQQQLARGILALTNRRAEEVATSVDQVPRARADMTVSAVLRLTRRYRMSHVAVEAADDSRELIGYIRVIDLVLRVAKRGSDSEELTLKEFGLIRPLIEISENTPHVDALVKMENASESMARVIDATGHTVGIVTDRNLRRPLFFGTNR